MSTISKKNIVISILAGAVFFLGAGTISFAQSSTPPQDKAGDALYETLNCNPLGGDISGCIPIIFYGAVYKPASWILIFAGKIFDFTLFLSIGKQYVDQGFVTSSWGIMRDVSNMAFIFILLYTGISTMLGFGNWKRTVIQVVIIALLVNFSLFFTKVVIDAGNVLAVGVYSSLGPAVAGQRQDISESIAAAFQPQRFILETKDVGAGEAIIIFIIAAIVSLSVSWVLFRVALVFIGRLIAFWFLMIVSPFAFVSSTFPKGNKFSGWLDMLLNQAFVAPVFLFLLYLIMKVVNTGILQGMVKSSGMGVGTAITNKLILPILIATLIVVALSKARSFAEGMAGEFGKLGAKLGGTVMGVAGGMAIGGAAFAGRATVGQAAYKLTQSDKVKKFAARSSLGRLTFSGADKIAGASFDARNAPGGGGLGFGKGSTGGFSKTVADAKKSDEAFVKKIETGKDGKPLMVEAGTGEYEIGPSGERVEKKRSGTTAETFAGQLKKGYYSRTGSGGNVGASQAAESILKKEKKRAEVEEKKKASIEKIEQKERSLETKQKGSISEFKEALGLPKDDERPLDQVENLKELKINKLEKLERAVAEAEAALSVVSEKDIVARTDAIVAKKKAEAALKKFEGLHEKIEKTEKEIDDLSTKKESLVDKMESKLNELKEDKKEKAEEKKEGGKEKKE